MKQLMDHIKAFGDWVVAAVGLFTAWITGCVTHIDFIAAEKVLIEVMRFATVAGSLYLVARQIRQKKKPKGDDES